MSVGCAGNVIDRAGATCHTDPSGCIAYVGAALSAGFCDGTVGVAGKGDAVGIGAI